VQAEWIAHRAHPAAQRPAKERDVGCRSNEALGRADSSSPCGHRSRQSAGRRQGDASPQGAPKLAGERGTSAALAEVPPAPAHAAGSEPAENLAGRGAIEGRGKPSPRPESYLALAHDRARGDALDLDLEGNKYIEDVTAFTRSAAAAVVEPAGPGFYACPGWGTSHPRIQLLTIRELLEGKGLDYPHVTGITFKKAPKAQPERADQLPLNVG
jgi:hypothetical protein